MRVAILECDKVAEKFQSQFGQYSEMIRHMFATTGSTFDFDVYNCQQGDYPPNLDRYDFFITTGSRAAAYAHETWIRQLIKFVHLLDDKRKILIGICFGHQVMAMACGGQVEKSDKGWGIGIARNRIVASPDWISEKRDELNTIVSHQDQIVQLPDDALVIAESDFCPYFIVQWNDHFLSIQGHPEWNGDYSRALINDRRDTIPRQRVEAGLDSLATQPDNPLFTNWILDFVRNRQQSN